MAKVRNLLPAGFVALAMACNLGARTGPVASVEGDIPTAESAATERSADTRADIPPGLLQPGDLEYLGAFRLPDTEGDYGWGWGGSAAAYYPAGDPGGAGDSHPGSIFATGTDDLQRIAEISIPEPVNSRDLEQLHTAVMLQDFAPLMENMFPDLEVPHAGLEYLPPFDGQQTGKLYYSRVPHLTEGGSDPALAWAETVLSAADPAGPWRIGDFGNALIGEYLFAIPTAWVDANLPGMYLAAGRYRDGGQGSMGPTIIAVAPWEEGNPPPAGAVLRAVPLLMYNSVEEENPSSLDGYTHSDEWSGAAWLTSESGSAVVFAGTKGAGATWYGCSDGVVWPEEPPFPDDCFDDNRGWWSDSFDGRIIFFDPGDLAAVARGEKDPWEPQPYAVAVVDSVLFHAGPDRMKYHLGAMTFDSERGMLYLFEPFADDDKPVVHVWQIG